MAYETQLLLLGLVFFVGLAAEALGRHTPLPRVTLLVLAGVAFGPSILGLVDPFGTRWFELVSQIALTMVGFLLGGKLTLSAMRAHGADVLSLSAAIVGGTIIFVGAAVFLVTKDAVLALLLAGIAVATAPAATTDVIQESGKGNRFTKTLVGIVAIDDAWGIAIFSLLLAAAASVGGGDIMQALQLGGQEIGGALLLGSAIGFPAAYLTGRVRPGDPTLAEALGLVFLCLGAALWLDVSFLLSAVTAGTVVANFAHHHDRPFHEIEHVEWPIMIVFFLLAGAALHLGSLLAIGVLGTAYVGARVLGRLVGGYGAARARGMPPATRRWIGPALLPQAGVSIGLALIAAQRFPDRSDVILAVVLGSTVLFEVAGPLLARLAIARTDGG